ncbi:MULTISPECIES: bifunctional PIG-L family deacetylase/class I SAM-dependent methyltransferase [unclassified Microbacterium]|uniref:bifunctional PIG-L family deacetylase/class I SAM-dependent methyltransferase n=1 Tax=unclassified Microbacterium TaxID=2609290 RepID=UPI00214BC267|nr:MULTISPECIES: bifunctional PIG-L family deacetylase/class I SAM-dependent methyltransferase [unclassified Microbacterium]MCR2808724.1 PIG-L family deacetylase [Microbacterium sp. zg.B185]WIM18845.1 bifunctional PIG-L family deacetylase/class I SAM-dependent methyltransferase [Microbacterium sp. zg-B185]
MTAAFSHLDAGTPEHVWRAEKRFGAVRTLDDDVDQLFVVAAHPDDETLGAGALIRRVHERGGRVTVLVATDGEASHPLSSTHSRADLRAIRRDEVVSALDALAPGANVLFLGLPDGALRENADELEARVAEAVDAAGNPADRCLIVAPWSGDRHRDHRVASAAAARVSAPRRIRHLGYPIWLWHWGGPEDVPWHRAAALALTPDEHSLKARAVRLHVSQIRPLSEAPGDEAVVHEAMQAHFARDTEFYLAEDAADTQSLPPEWFADFYARHEDPWGFETRWYEERKRALLLASLPARSIGRALEVGCSTGLITRALAARADSLVAIDPSRVAVQSARARVGDDPTVTIVQGSVPGDWPAGAFDTIVLSEVGYYLSETDLASTIALIEAALAEDGCLIACHWRHPVAEYPLSGDQVHHALRSVTSWQRLVFHEEEDFLLELFCHGTAVSVAHREGLR